MAGSSAVLDAAAGFIWSNARLLERRLFAHHFLGAPGELVVAALRAYQNVDGGFGNALEPDKRCPDSQPIDQEIGLRALDAAGWDREVAGGVCDFLSTITTSEGGVPSTLPSANAYPHAPWWGTEEASPPASLNPTASIAGLLLKNGAQHPWIERATEFCWKGIEAGSAADYGEDHTLLAVLIFLQHAPDRPRAERAFEAVGRAIVDGGHVALDPQAEGYVKKPLDWAPTPDSLCRPLFADDVIAAHLDALAARQQPDGGWPITWPAVTPACELEYRGYVTVEALTTLRAYGRV